MKKLHVAAIFVAALAATTLAFSTDLDEALAEQLPMEAENFELMPEDGPAPLSEDMLERAEGNETTTVAPVVDNGCKDVYPAANRCPGWARSGYCTSSSYSTWMKLYCRNSCNNCKSCFDQTSSCSSTAQRGYCNRPSNFGYYNAYCPVSCGICKLNSANCADILSSDMCGKLKNYCHYTFMKNNCRKYCNSISKSCSQCADTQSSGICNVFKSAGYCTNSSTRTLMMSNCRRTCEFC